MRTRSLRTVVNLGGAFGLLLSLFAAAEVLDPALSSVCSVNQVVSCSTVLNSGRTMTLYVPDWTWGVAGFLAILIVSGLAHARRKDPRYAYGLLALTTAGVGLAVYLLYVEVALIHALCPVCLASYLMGGIAWAGSIGLARRAHRRASREPSPDSGTTERSAPADG